MIAAFIQETPRVILSCIIIMAVRTQIQAPAYKDICKVIKAHRFLINSKNGKIKHNTINIILPLLKK